MDTRSHNEVFVSQHSFCQDIVASLGAQHKESTCQYRRRLRSLGQEVLRKKKMATHSSIGAWRIPWTEEPGRLQSMGSQKSQT